MFEDDDYDELVESCRRIAESDWFREAEERREREEFAKLFEDEED